VQGTGLPKRSGALLEQICDVFARKRLEDKSIFHGPLYGLIAVNFTQGNNLSDMVKRVHAALFKLSVVSVGLIGQR
jgi:hypothetical protein